MSNQSTKDDAAVPDYVPTEARQVAAMEARIEARREAYIERESKLDQREIDELEDPERFGR